MEPINKPKANFVIKKRQTINQIKTTLQKPEKHHLFSILARYVHKGITLPEILKLEAPTNKILQLELTLAYGEYVVQYLDDLPIELARARTLALNDDNVECDDDCDESEEEELDTQPKTPDTPDQNLLRKNIQSKYHDSIIAKLAIHSRALVKAPTGFGKTVILYNLINHYAPDLTVILTPRRNLNVQTLDDKYKQHLTNPEQWAFYNFSPDSSQTAKSKKQSLEAFIIQSRQDNKKMIILACYQHSSTILLDYCISKDITIDLCVNDEAHEISGWGELKKDFQKTFFQSDIIRKRVFATATPTPDMVAAPDLFGEVIEHVQIYELINAGILCPFEVLVKHCRFETRQPDIARYTMATMRKFNKRKGLVYCINIKNAIEIYGLLKSAYPDHETYLYVNKSKQITQKTFDDLAVEKYNEAFRNVKFDRRDTILKNFKETTNPAIIVSVRMLSYGYDDAFIDLIVPDTRKSEYEIRQMIGRGMRNNPLLYPGKILHILLPITRKKLLKEGENDSLSQDNDARSKSKNEYDSLKNFLQFIVGECGYDIIRGMLVNRVSKQSVPAKDTKASNTEEEDTDEDDEEQNIKYDKIPVEICHELSTTTYGTYSKFLGFLRRSHVYDETTYNTARTQEGNPEWFPILGEVRKKFKKFCFLDIKAPENAGYYQTAEECLSSIYDIKQDLIKELGGILKVKKMLKSQFNKKLEEEKMKDARIPENIFLFYHGIKEDDI